MLNIKISKAEIDNARALFQLIDRIRKYVSDSVVGATDPDTGADIRLYFVDDDTIRFELYRSNHWIMERTYKRTGEMSDFKPTRQW